MWRRLLLCSAVIATSAFASAVRSAAAATTTYQVIDLGSLGDRTSNALGINRSGQVAGFSRLPAGGYDAFIWQSGVMTDVGSDTTYGYGLNDAGWVVGVHALSGGQYRAFVYDGSTVRHIGTLGGLQSTAYAINDDNEVVGFSTTASGAGHAIRWHRGTLTDLGTLPGDRNSKAVSTVTTGVAVGSSWGGSSGTRAVMFASGSVTALPVPAGTINSEANAINRNGVVVGWVQQPNQEEQPALWDAAGAHVLLPPGENGSANAVNGFGKVVGWIRIVFPTRSTTHAALFRDGRAIDLQTRIPSDSGWRLRSANGINGQGMIVGYGFHNGIARGFLLVPVTAAASRITHR